MDLALGQFGDVGNLSFYHFLYFGNSQKVSTISVMWHPKIDVVKKQYISEMYCFFTTSGFSVAKLWHCRDHLRYDIRFRQRCLVQSSESSLLKKYLVLLHRDNIIDLQDHLDGLSCKTYLFLLPNKGFYYSKFCHVRIAVGTSWYSFAEPSPSNGRDFA